jgi:hypothetical protein
VSPRIFEIETVGYFHGVPSDKSIRSFSKSHQEPHRVAKVHSPHPLEITPTPGLEARHSLTTDDHGRSTSQATQLFSDAASAPSWVSERPSRERAKKKSFLFDPVPLFQ